MLQCRHPCYSIATVNPFMTCIWYSIGASILREASYSTIRLGAYEPFKELLGAHNPAKTPLWKKIAAGASSGAIGSAVASPTDLVKIRLQAEGSLKPG